jgi:hypothetical protein
MYACVVGLFKGTTKVYGGSAGSCDAVLAMLVGAGDCVSRW